MKISTDIKTIENYIYVQNHNVSLFLFLFISIALGQIMLYVDGMNGKRRKTTKEKIHIFYLLNF